METLIHMKRQIELPFLFRVVAILEFTFALIGTLIPPTMVTSVTGLVLTADGLWIVKLLSMALASQAWVAWVLRNEPHRGVAKALAFYQLGSATVDWVMWLALADRQIFSTLTAKSFVITSIATHYTLGLLLVFAIRAERRLGDGAR